MRKGVGVLIALAVGLTLAGCSSSSSSGPTTTSVASTTAASSGGSTPQAVTTAFLTAIETGNYSSFCVLAVPSQVAACKSATSDAGGTIAAKNLAIGSVEIVGDRGVVTITGTLCANEQCQSNSTPNLATSNGQTFAQAFASATSTSSQNSSPFLAALVRQNGRWYATGF